MRIKQTKKYSASRDTGAATLSTAAPKPAGQHEVATELRPMTGWSRRTMLAALLLAVALAIAVYLVRLAFVGGSVAGCGPESGCGEVLKSRWSHVLGLPVSLFGAGIYAFLLFCSLFLEPSSRAQRRLEAMASVLVLGGALWFTVIQALVLRAFCPWCCTAHALASVGVVVLWRARRAGPSPLPSDSSMLPFGALAAVAVVGLAIVQSVGPVPERIQETRTQQAVVASADLISLHDGRIQLDPATLPVIGLPQAAVTTVALTDFTCPQCRELHRTLNQQASERPGQFNTVLLPGAFEPGAREIHRILLTLWRIEPAQYRELAEGLIEGSINPTPQEVLDRVQQHWGGKFYERAWAEAGWVQDTLKLGEQLLALNATEAKASTLPQLMIGDRVLTGAPRAETLAPLIAAAAAGAPAAATPTVAAAAPSAASGAAAAATSPSARVAAGAAAPVIDFGSTTVELGQVTRGESVTKKITFTNTGGSPLTLKNIKAGCGCTTVQGWQQTVAPGQQGSFEIKLDSTNFAGLVTKTVDVDSDASNSSVKLFLKADVWAPVRLSSSSASFGNVIKGSAVVPKEIEITVTDSEPLKLGGVTSSNPYFNATLKPIEEGRRYQLMVSVPELGEKAQNGQLVLALGHPKMRELTLSAHITPVDPLVAQPQLVVVPASTLISGATAAVTVFCHDPALAKLEVTDMAYSGAEGVSLAFEKNPNDRWGRVVMSFPAGYTPAAPTGSFLSFRTNHPSQQQFKLPVHFNLPGPAPIMPAGRPAALPPAAGK
jgi:uncharacterized membrane protein